MAFSRKARADILLRAFAAVLAALRILWME
jgi:hypothetical protein